MRLEIMRNDESFAGMNGNKVFLKRDNGEVRIVSFILDGDGIMVDKDREVVIGFGKGAVTVGDMDEDIEITSF